MAEREEEAPEQKPGIVVTDADGKGGQGFIPAEVAEASGIRVTGTAEPERAPAETEETAPKRSTKKASRKK